MDLLTKLIEDFLMENVGKDVLDVLKLLKGKEPVSEFVLADKLKLTVNQVRNMLYRLYSYSLVDFIRKKDKKKGWYIYYWDFNTKRALEVALEHKRKRLDMLRKLLGKEEGSEYFSCRDCEVRLDFEGAVGHDYKCPECDKVLVQEDNSRKKQRLMKIISVLEGEIKKGKEIKVEERKLLEKISKGRARRKAKKPAKRKAKKKVSRKKPAKRKAKRKAKPRRKVKRKPARKRKAVRKKVTKRKARPRLRSRKKPAKRKAKIAKAKSKSKRKTKRRKR